MFQLIVTVISIALIAILAVATLWFGGLAFPEGGEKVEFTRIRAGAFQIETALNMYFADNGVYPEGASQKILDELVARKYLVSIPTGGSEGGYDVENKQIVRALASEEQCFKLNKMAGVTATDECPPCADPAFGNYIACQK